VQEIIRNTIISVKLYTNLELFSNNDSNLSITILNNLYLKTTEILTKIAEPSIQADARIELLQHVIDKLSMVICGFGTNYISDLLFICFGSEFNNPALNNPILLDKFNIIKQHIKPIGYKLIPWKASKKITDKTGKKRDNYCCNKITDENTRIEDSLHIECFDVDKSTTISSLFNYIHGVRVVIQNEKLRKTLIIFGITDELQIDCFNNKYICIRKNSMTEITNQYSEDEKPIFQRIVDTLSLKDILVYGDGDIQKKMRTVFAEVNLVKHQKLDNTIKRFLEMDMFTKRDMLINLILYESDNEIKYISYLLYDLIAIQNRESSELNLKTDIYSSLPYKIKQYFKDVLKNGIKYANEITQTTESAKISLEQQIQTLKINPTAKEKAMVKFREIKGKNDEMCTKSRQFLEGLVKIPFGIYREEPILTQVKMLNRTFIHLSGILTKCFPEFVMTKKEKYSISELKYYINSLITHVESNVLDNIKKCVNNLSVKQIIDIAKFVNAERKLLNERKTPIANKSKQFLLDYIIQFVDSHSAICKQTLLSIYDKFMIDCPTSLCKTIADLNNLKSEIEQFQTRFHDISETLDISTHSHMNAKNQLIKIMGQWINGEQTGYCFGFEGSPGIGKTSLAKYGLSKCLIDETGEPRPFAFIAMGGSTNGSTLEGHGYTYVNSTWGKIVDILMDSKCMNPIIYIDELDKISKTEQGRELIGIFTHLIDPTQNDSFQDKYFNGINIDMSKALFIFSYNDPEQIDRILLDRIHRIKFDNLILEDKRVIVTKHIVPEINRKMGFDNVVALTENVIDHIITAYTNEPGVRKLKELLFDLYGEININLLRNENAELIELPVILTPELIDDKYLTKYCKIKDKLIHPNPEIGIINGLWANSLGRGGVIPIQTMWYPSTTFLDLKLTGLQGDVMKESMNVAKSLAWYLTPNEMKQKWILEFETTKCQGLHIHCPDGATSKDGPSAGAAITTALYSLINGKKIRNDVAITGEINLQGEVTPIGGLDVKISGGIRAGIKTFIYPESNSEDFQKWNEKCGTIALFDEITFHEVKTIQEVFQIVFV
jgi:ATP-dependent Lon protease